jgi:AraC-like DNA-binding protein
MMREMQTGEHTSELGEWQTVQRAADPRLRAYVQGYFASSSKLCVPVRERHLPSAEVPLLINFGAPHRSLNAVDAGEWTTRDGAWVVGLHTRHQLTQAAGERHFMVVRFTPIGAHLFLRLPMDLIANEALDVGAIDPALARVLMRRVGLARNWADRFTAMEVLIAERIADAQMAGSVSHVWRRLVATDGRIALGLLADELDCSHRTLIARFRTCIGFPPKTIARLLRFNRVMRSLDSSSRTRANESVGKPYIESTHADDRRVGAIRWADIAADCGYFDQAHLINDFRAFAGSTPDAFLRRVSDFV